MDSIHAVHRLYLIVILLFLGAAQILPDALLESITGQILVSQLLLVLLPVLLFVRTKGLSRDRWFPLNRVRKEDFLYIPAITVCLLPVGSFFNALVLYMLGRGGNPPAAPALDIFALDGPLWLSILLLTLLPGLVEELFSRGVLLGGYRPAGRLSAIFLSALLFALLHLHPVNFFSPLLLGLFFGWLVTVTGNILTAVLGHSLFNLLVLSLQLFLPRNSTAVPVVGPGDLAAAFPSAAFFAGLGILLFLRYRRRFPPLGESGLQATRTLIRLIRDSFSLQLAVSLYLLVILLQAQR